MGYIDKLSPQNFDYFVPDQLLSKNLNAAVCDLIDTQPTRERK